MKNATEEQVNALFDKYEAEGFAPHFWTPHGQHKDCACMPFKVLGRCREDENHGLEALPMWRIQLVDGDVIEAGPEEVIPSEMRANGCADEDILSYFKVGSYDPAHNGKKAKVEREWYGQGMVFKDEEAYWNRPDELCYMPELVDGPNDPSQGYTHNDILAMCNGQEEFAWDCFVILDWQHPGSLIEENFANSEWGYCPKCKKLFWPKDDEGWDFNLIHCPECGTESDPEQMGKEETA